MFDLFLGLLSNLSQPTHPDFGRYYYLLESLVKTRFATMLANKDHLETTVVKLFAMFFKLAPVSNSNKRKRRREGESVRASRRSTIRLAP